MIQFRGPCKNPVYRFEALCEPVPGMEAEWEELIFKGDDLDDCKRRADSFRDKMYPLGVRVVHIETNKVEYVATKLGFNGRICNIKL